MNDAAPAVPLEFTFFCARGPVRCFACPTCGKIERANGVPDFARRTAAACCDPRCDVCGAPAKGRLRCEPCAAVRAAEVEAARFAKAEKVPEAAHDGWLSWEDRGPRDGYFEDAYELRAWCLDNDVAMPAYAYACERLEFGLDAEDIVEQALDGHHEDATDRIPQTEMTRLQKFLDAWCAAQGVASWFEDASRAVVLDPARNAEAVEEARQEQLGEEEATMDTNRVTLADLESYDWQQAFEYGNPSGVEGYAGSTEPFRVPDVAAVIAAVTYDDDGTEVLAVLRLKDGRFAFLAAGCDNSGRDCCGQGYARVAATLDDLIRWGIGQDQRTRLGLSLPEEST